MMALGGGLQTLAGSYVSPLKYAYITLSPPALPQEHLALAMAPPQTQLQWTVQGRDGPDSWVLDKNAAVPTPGDKDVLVKCVL